MCGEYMWQEQDSSLHGHLKSIAWRYFGVLAETKGLECGNNNI
ncbi:hypothetical protein SAMN06295998_1104 [Primorskyibacter flagellatus]|uniref:Uncharacterized protein n=1 Tax=Primorskyibacter flagellatus TaxID=1387277 RepID=A0A1W2CZ93_9RHOB|nr:hypothetical protein SAMN06295998_1104 [Primorskyibacter flagellatus]